ncbi:putative glycosyltransferase [Gordonia rhizosphera NBRC 16068]|uniref:Putative glycosyltransferase n=1 Tax=Gordonia rhizosphera NBRC 16068 TaxID=1108045 RepID=K6WI07_9ACTN|nr:putative glycosyltransferase [Gordonia rhizosphera NBRC 16068]
MVRARSLGQAAVWAGTCIAFASLALTIDNARRIRVPDRDVIAQPESLAVLLPVRNEIDNVRPCLAATLAAVERWPGPVRVIVVDDESTDGTGRALAEISATDSRVEVLTGAPTPDGWLGKPWACEQLVRHADSTGDPPEVLVFVDADVRLRPHALVATIALMRAANLDLVCPFPRQVLAGPAERLVQPLLQWSWMSTLPLGPAERSARPSLSAANGQLLAVDAATYRAAGGHAAVAGEVIEDIALLRAVKAAGGRGLVAEGSGVADCRMYDGWREIRAGYRKSLWTAFGSTGGAAAVMAVMALAYVVPPIAAVRGSRIGLIGYFCGVASRVAVARRTRGHAWPDALAHPASVLALVALTADSLVARCRGTLQWKDRSLGAPG